MDEVVARVQEAVEAGDWAAVRPLLHPYLHWTQADGSVLRGRTKILAVLQASPGAPRPPRSVELRDGQVYRWQM